MEGLHECQGPGFSCLGHLGNEPKDKRVFLSAFQIVSFLIPTSPQILHLGGPQCVSSGGDPSLTHGMTLLPRARAHSECSELAHWTPVGVQEEGLGSSPGQSCAGSTLAVGASRQVLMLCFLNPECRQPQRLVPQNVPADPPEGAR